MVGRMIMGLMLAAMLACRDVGPGKSVDLSILRSADSIEVRTAADRIVARVTNRASIERALSFIQQHHDGWREPWYGPHVPRLMLYFYERDRKLGGFGLDHETLVLDPTMRAGWVSRDVSKDEVEGFLRDLGVTWAE
jgi:hypothetical protein